MVAIAVLVLTTLVAVVAGVFAILTITRASKYVKDYTNDLYNADDMDGSSTAWTASKGMKDQLAGIAKVFKYAAYFAAAMGAIMGANSVYNGEYVGALYMIATGLAVGVIGHMIAGKLNNLIVGTGNKVVYDNSGSMVAADAEVATSTWTSGTDKMVVSRRSLVQAVMYMAYGITIGAGMAILGNVMQVVMPKKKSEMPGKGLIGKGAPSPSGAFWRQMYNA